MIITVVLWLAAEVTFVAGTAIPWRLDGPQPLDILGLLPGIVLRNWAMERYERWRGRHFEYYNSLGLFLLLFGPAVALGFWLAFPALR